MADIVSAASSLFGAHGFDGTTMNAIAQRAKVSIGSLYQYFPDKEAIVDAVADSYIEAWDSTNEALLPSAEEIDLAKIARRTVQVMVDFDRRHAAIRAFLHADPQRGRSILEVQTRINPASIPLLARFYPQSKQRELARVIEIVSLVIRNVAPQIGEEPQEAKRARLIREIAAVVLAYVTAELGAPNLPATSVAMKKPDGPKMPRKTR